MKTYIITWLRGNQTLYLSEILGSQSNWSHDIKDALRFSQNNIPNLCIDKFYQVHDLSKLRKSPKEAARQIAQKHEQTN
jgi:hypothetical protein